MIDTTKTDWNLSPLLNGDDDPSIEQKLEKVKEANSSFVEKWENRDDFLKDPKILKQALDEYENLLKDHGLSGDPGYYFELRFYQDQANPDIKAKQNKIEETSKKLENELKFFTLKIAKIPKENRNDFLKSKELKDYKHFLERNFDSSKHLLTEKEEKILNLKQSTSHDHWEKMTSGLLAKQEREIEIEGKKENKNFSELLSLLENRNHDIREKASEALNEIFSKYTEVAEAEINAILANHKVNSELRNFPRPDSARHLEDNIKTETVDIVTSSVP